VFIALLFPDGDSHAIERWSLNHCGVGHSPTVALLASPVIGRHRAVDFESKFAFRSLFAEELCWYLQSNDKMELATALSTLQHAQKDMTEQNESSQARLADLQLMVRQRWKPEWTCVVIDNIF